MSALARAVVAADPLGATGVRAAAERAVLDHVACAALCDADPAARDQASHLLAWARAEGEPVAGRPVLGTDARLAPSRAALVGGFRAHLLDLDDTHEDVRGHPSASLVPTLIALADDAAPLPDVLAAHAVGLEAMARLGRALGPAHYAAGFHPTATAGAVGAAAAGAHLLRLDEGTTARALSLAASRSAGVRAQFGTPAKPLHAGMAAQAGVEAVQWALAGIGAADDAVAGSVGLLASHGVEADVREALTSGFGQTWAIAAPGLWMKRSPFCSAAMGLVEAAAELADELDGTVDERAARIVGVRVRMRPGADAALVHRAPRTGEEARFSAEALVALALLGVPRDLAHLGAEPLDPRARALAGRVVREHVSAGTRGTPSAPGPDPRTGRAVRDMWSGVDVELADGRVLAAQVDRPAGSPQRPLPDTALRAKAAEALGEERAAALVALLAGPDATVGALTALAVAGAP
ncbi:MmgE/PrpD family protein [Brachybacterium nesterenkovii]|uniref:MmgE/PrpD family protein n=1 Tax=Brachybacterium nesterenkovii TaxID=47847 RepID=A0A1X6X4T9_9MICO|nr:MmgE/PrpD family protein [Brachybacterium nesterenkovii]SLM94026.1 MmgE/PrpD family protein [Brachybacterium nesterenkovii]